MITTAKQVAARLRGNLWYDDVADTIDALCAALEAKDATLLSIARKAEMLKTDCGEDPESQQAIRNGRYMHLSYLARAAAGRPRSPS